MKARTLAVLSLAAVLAACATTPKQAPPALGAPTKADWEALFAGDYDCAPRAAKAVDFQTVTAAPERYYDTCVHTRALLKDGVLWQNAATLGAHAPNGTIALYVRGDTIKPDAPSTPRFVSVVGRLRSCPERAQRIHELLMRMPAPTEPADPGARKIIVIPVCTGVQGPALFAATVEPLPTAMD